MYYVVTAKHKSEEEIVSIREATVAELIEREKQELMDTVARMYVFARHQDEDFEMRLQKLKEFDMQGEEFFLRSKVLTSVKDICVDYCTARKKARLI